MSRGHYARTLKGPIGSCISVKGLEFWVFGLFGVCGASSSYSLDLLSLDMRVYKAWV